MLFIGTTAQSYTGQFLYSDSCGVYEGEGYNGKPQDWESKDGMSRIRHNNGHPFSNVPFLNKWAHIPIVGSFAGITRMALAIIHMIGHLFASVIFLDTGHLGHSLKGAAEFIRGAIETIPIAGSYWSWRHDHPLKTFWLGHYNPDLNSEASCFLVKIYNPSQLDFIDRVFILDRKHTLT